MRPMTLSSVVVLLAVLPATVARAAETITVRTENFARPPYSGATYYIYERAGRTVCTKLSVCNKFDQCNVSYEPGAYKAPEDAEAGAPFATTPAVAIAPDALYKHRCLTRFGAARGF